MAAERKTTANQAGFSLLEMMVVLAIIALAVSIAAPRFQAGSAGRQFASEAEQAVQLLSRARVRAIASGRPVDVRLDVRERSLTTANERRVVLAAAAGVTAIVGDQTLTGARSATLTFLADGSCPGAEFLLTAESGEKIVILVSWLTGMARLRNGGGNG